MDRSMNVVDVRGKCCPLYIIEAKWALDRCRPGAALKILATDPEFPRDLEAFCRQTGNRIVESSSSKDEFAFVVRKCRSERFVA